MHPYRLVSLAATVLLAACSGNGYDPIDCQPMGIVRFQVPAGANPPDYVVEATVTCADGTTEALMVAPDKLDATTFLYACGAEVGCAWTSEIVELVPGG